MGSIPPPHKEQSYFAKSVLKNYPLIRKNCIFQISCIKNNGKKSIKILRLILKAKKIPVWGYIVLIVPNREEHKKTDVRVI